MMHRPIIGWPMIDASPAEMQVLSLTFSWFINTAFFPPFLAEKRQPKLR
jgi:hypothetical protein